jgi:FAD/FMN-containing dehydrogenase
MASSEPRNNSSGLVADAAIARLREGLQGTLIRPADSGYESTRRVWNWAYDRRPGMIVRCAGTVDVVRAVDFARSHDLPVAIRSGGHSFAALSVCDGGMMIDLSGLKAIQVDSASRVVHVQAGVTIGELDRATAAFALAVPLGTCASAGIAGLTLGGGEGMLSAKYGATCDNLNSLEVVTAEGALLQASAVENEDLFWALRGGGGNFGVAISFEYRLHPIDWIAGGALKYEMSQAKVAMRFLRDYARTVPDELALFAGFMPFPGTQTFDIAACYCGDRSSAEKVLAPLRSFARPLEDSIAPIRYLDLQSFATDVPADPQLASYRKAGLLPELSDPVIEVILANMTGRPSAACGLSLFYLHGAMCRVPAEAMAFGFRRPGYEFWPHSYWLEPGQAKASTAWVDKFFSDLEPFSTGAVYVDELGDEGEARVRAAYGTNYDRLVAFKNKYDPTNFFRMNQNIKPTV